MGFLHESEPLTWEQAMAHLRFVRAHGIEQFVSIFNRCKGADADPFRWGDEVEHQIFRLVGDSAERSVKASLRSPEIMAELQALEKSKVEAEESCCWMPEFGRWMLESTPGKPYDGLDGVLAVEKQLQVRRTRLQEALRPDELAPTVTAFPLLGVGNFSEPAFPTRGPVLDSLFVPDETLFPHPRFPTLARNIRARRGSKVEIRRPKMNVDLPSSETSLPKSVQEADALDYVYADAMPFGMGSSCLQVTLQAKNIAESRHLYDQLASLTPILLALTAATPFMRGWICDDDARWGQISQSVDDRTAAERSTNGEVGDARLAGSGTRPLRKSRYDGIDCYIGEDEETEILNDLPLAFDQDHLDRLLDAGIDKNLALHVAHLFARDPLVIFEDRLDLNDQQDIDHWENLQSTNWQTLRWKPPPPHKGVLSSDDKDHIGWRVEFRSMELQLTDFENAAFISFVVAISRAILDLQLDLRIPISKLDTNMAAAGRRAACTQESFWFRTNPSGAGSPEYQKLHIHEILNGKGSFPGLLPLCQKYLEESCSLQSQELLKSYFSFISQRALGELPTPATWMRNFVMRHSSYNDDGRVPAAAAHDLLVQAAGIGAGLQRCPDLLGSFCSCATSNSCHDDGLCECRTESFKLVLLDSCPLRRERTCPLITAV